MPALPLRGLATLLCSTVAVLAQAPPGYYDPVDLGSAARLRATLHEVIDDHLRLPYTATGLDTWDVLEAGWQDPADPTRVVDVYRNGSFRKPDDRVTGYNREHVWPRSYGFPEDRPDNQPYTDCHALFLADAGYNAARGNLPFDTATALAREYPTLPTNGQGGGSGRYPGNSNWGIGSAGAFGSFEVWSRRRGDVARAILYLDVRYEGGTHGRTGIAEPDLIATDDRARIAASQTGNNEAVAHMGLLSTLLAWHREDPPDADERRRNDLVFQAQGNRNPFVDHPEWAGLLFGGAVPGGFLTYGAGCAGSNGIAPTSGSAGEPLVGRSLTLVCGGAPALRPALLNFDLQPSQIDLAAFGLGGCALLARPALVVTATTNGFGTAATALAVPADPRLVGTSLFGQWVVLDPAGRGAALSPGAELRFGRR
jgi:endonuclease I